MPVHVWCESPGSGVHLLASGLEEEEERRDESEGTPDGMPLLLDAVSVAIFDADRGRSSGD